MSDTRNCHYITRSLTKPWEDSERFLIYYDFEQDRFGRCSSRSLFAEHELNSQLVEGWLSRCVEQPLSQLRASIASGSGGRPFDECPLYRAACLMLWLQGVRGDSVVNVASREQLEEIATGGVAMADKLAAAIHQQHELVLVSTAADADMVSLLVFPSTALFPVPLQDPTSLTQYSFAMGLPLSPTRALVALRRRAENAQRPDLNSLPGLIVNSAVGLAPANRVLIPRAMRDEIEDAELQRLLRELREANVTLARSIAELPQLVDQMAGIAGVALVTGPDSHVEFASEREST